MVTGERRSGTTLLANLLNANDQITVYRDFLHIARLQQLVAAPALGDPLTQAQKDRLIAHFDSREITRRAGRISPTATRVMEDVATHGTVDVRPAGFDNLVEFYRKTLERIAAPDDLVVGHKTTSAHDAVAELLNAIPELHVIYMLRDPRDVTISAMKRFPHERWSDHVAGWRASYRTMRHLVGRPDLEPRILLVRFEDLLLQTDETLSTMARFLGIGGLQVPATMTDYGQQWRDNSSFDDLEKGPEDTGESGNRGGSGGVLRTTPVGRWRGEDPDLGRLVESLLCDVMERAGYPPSVPVSPAERQRAEVKFKRSRLTQRPRRLLRRAKLKIMALLKARKEG
jgi:hypothetical protein